MNANIVIKLNSGESFAYGNVDTKDDFEIGRAWLTVGHDDSDKDFRLEDVKEILVKILAPKPVVEEENR